jgi:Flp pilus assembly protein TadG
MTKIIPRTKQRPDGERGAVLITVAIVLLLLFGFAAFAIDFGYSYVVRNKLQNAADASALAGASVLFTSNQLCLASERPYSCCTGDHTGSCIPGVVEVDSVTETAETLAAMNHSGGNDTTVNVEIGHYAFAPIWGTPGTFDAATPTDGQINQMSGWQTIAFDVLNNNTAFINAVRVTVTRGDIPRFFSRIWSSENDLQGAVRAIAYIGFAGTLGPGEADQPIAICQDSITTSTGALKCNVGTMLNNNTQTSRWTDFDQTEPCTGSATDNEIRDLICKNGNITPITGIEMTTTNGSQGNSMTDIYECWSNDCKKENCTNPAKYDSDNDGVPDTLLDITGDGKPDYPWKITLPVVDCSTTGGCLKVVGAVEVNVVWINNTQDTSLDKEKAWYPSNMYNPLTSSMWSCPSSDTPETCWSSFQQEFDLQNNNLSGPAQWGDKSLYFLPDCTVHTPIGTTGGPNLGIQARFPVLVK